MIEEGLPPNLESAKITFQVVVGMVHGGVDGDMSILQVIQLHAPA